MGSRHARAIEQEAQRLARQPRPGGIQIASRQVQKRLRTDALRRAEASSAMRRWRASLHLVNSGLKDAKKKHAWASTLCDAFLAAGMSSPVMEATPTKKRSIW